MWIRSQNRASLVEAKRLRVCKVESKFEIFNEVLYVDNVSDNYDMLGEYESRERALEILDDIQENISVLEHDKVYKSHKEEMYVQGRYIYEMPQE